MVFYNIACIKGLKQNFTGVEINLIVILVRTTKWINRDKDKNYILGVKNEKKQRAKAEQDFWNVYRNQVYDAGFMLKWEICSGKKNRKNNLRKIAI